MTIYGIKTCDSVRKAIKYMKNHDVDYEFIDFRVTPIEKDKIDEWIEKSDINKLFNTQGTTYRTLKLKELNLTDIDKADWLAKENMLIKRPIIEYDGSIIVGYNLEDYDTLLDKKN